jgi:hypothetical protein
MDAARLSFGVDAILTLPFVRCPLKFSIDKPCRSFYTVHVINADGVTIMVTEFFRALYWSYEGRDVRLTMYKERDLPDAALTRLAFARARRAGLSPIFQRVFWGEFLRHGNDDEIGIAWPRSSISEALNMDDELPGMWERADFVE